MNVLGKFDIYTKIKPVSDKLEVQRVVNFLLSKSAFDLEMTEFRRKARKEAVFGSLKERNRQFWYTENPSGQIIAAIGVAENERQNGGYYLDYFAVHKDHRRQGFGSCLLKKAEDFIRTRKGRYLIIDTGDTEKFKAARKFYQKNGYQKVGHIPEYYEKGDGRIDFYKKFEK